MYYCKFQAITLDLLRKFSLWAFVHKTRRSVDFEALIFLNVLQPGLCKIQLCKRLHWRRYFFSAFATRSRWLACGTVTSTMRGPKPEAVSSLRSRSFNSSTVKWSTSGSSLPPPGWVPTLHNSRASRYLQMVFSSGTSPDQYRGFKIVKYLHCHYFYYKGKKENEGIFLIFFYYLFFLDLGLPILAGAGSGGRWFYYSLPRG